MGKEYDKNMIFSGAIKYHILSYFFLMIKYDKIWSLFQQEYYIGNVFSAHSFKMIFLYDIVRMEKNDKKS